ncbi:MULTISPECIES: sigma-E factor negative regulatory protein [Burkholderia]|uniref:Anti-sigma factor n=1 Tax=Burkholderia gladioli TaxID=28095 RepID=A0A2A7S6J8_BURGA|nr:MULTISPECIES: RseA family anti-sigma factor [Burkholderia]ATF85071.1 anti-sigma factor [Burkholderia gladioli pv. gladioli]MBJ9663018.1 anti-sigma factor [Burkholderia gladioli]MBJ9712608.1 anti-sigma factor [Burkholderia gladioli]MBU9156010.1 sigma-E factor negative regulatory protein [Burkholderia gladioli]MBU9168610.1 sigma-E factor negative regulatory protein [Burkholderia gladioli]
MGSVSTQSQPSSQRERLSALIDGESPDGLPFAQILAGFGDTERRAWSEFHAIGDVLRSDELAIEPTVSHAFTARFSAAFAAEPHLIAPAAITVAANSPASPLKRALRRRFVPALAVAAAAATLTWIVVPQLQGTAGQPGVSPVQVASVAPQDLQRVAASSHQDLNIIRDASLDQYLEAHQQFAQQPVVSGSMPLIRTAVATQGQ